MLPERGPPTWLRLRTAGLAAMSPPRAVKARLHAEDVEPGYLSYFVSASGGSAYW